MYAGEAGAIEQYVLMTGSAGGTLQVPYEEAREYDEHRHYDKDAICAIALGTQQVARVRSPDEREAALRVRNAEKWATRRHITIPGPFGDVVLLEGLLRWIEQYGTDNAVKRQHDVAIGIARIYSRCVSGTNLRMLMSSSRRWRSGLMGLSLIGGSCLEVGVLDPSILKTERPPVIRVRSNGYCARHNAPDRAASALPQERVRSLTPNRHHFSRPRPPRGRLPRRQRGPRTQAFLLNHHLVGEIVGGVAGAGLTTP